MTITEEQRSRFLEEIVEVCQRHCLILSHEDGHGSFLVEPLDGGKDDESAIAWIKAAYVPERR